MSNDELIIGRRPDKKKPAEELKAANRANADNVPAPAQPHIENKANSNQKSVIDLYEVKKAIIADENAQENLSNLFEKLKTAQTDLNKNNSSEDQKVFNTALNQTQQALKQAQQTLADLDKLIANAGDVNEKSSDYAKATIKEAKQHAAESIKALELLQEQLNAFHMIPIQVAPLEKQQAEPADDNNIIILNKNEPAPQPIHSPPQSPRSKHVEQPIVETPVFKALNKAEKALKNLNKVRLDPKNGKIEQLQPLLSVAKKQSDDSFKAMRQNQEELNHAPHISIPKNNENVEPSEIENNIIFVEKPKDNLNANLKNMSESEFENKELPPLPSDFDSEFQNLSSPASSKEPEIPIINSPESMIQALEDTTKASQESQMALDNATKNIQKEIRQNLDRPEKLAEITEIQDFEPIADINIDPFNNSSEKNPNLLRLQIAAKELQEKLQRLHSELTPQKMENLENDEIINVEEIDLSDEDADEKVNETDLNDEEENVGDVNVNANVIIGGLNNNLNIPLKVNNSIENEVKEKIADIEVKNVNENENREEEKAEDIEAKDEKIDEKQKAEDIDPKNEDKDKDEEEKKIADQNVDDLTDEEGEKLFDDDDHAEQPHKNRIDLREIEAVLNSYDSYSNKLQLMLALQISALDTTISEAQKIYQMNRITPDIEKDRTDILDRLLTKKTMLDDMQTQLDSITEHLDSIQKQLLLVSKENNYNDYDITIAFTLAERAKQTKKDFSLEEKNEHDVQTLNALKLTAERTAQTIALLANEDTIKNHVTYDVVPEHHYDEKTGTFSSHFIVAQSIGKEQQVDLGFSGLTYKKTKGEKANPPKIAADAEINAVNDEKPVGSLLEFKASKETPLDEVKQLQITINMMLDAIKSNHIAAIDPAKPDEDNRLYIASTNENYLKNCILIAKALLIPLDNLDIELTQNASAENEATAMPYNDTAATIYRDLESHADNAVRQDYQAVQAALRAHQVVYQSRLATENDNIIISNPQPVAVETTAYTLREIRSKLVNPDVLTKEGKAGKRQTKVFSPPTNLMAQLAAKSVKNEVVEGAEKEQNASRLFKPDEYDKPAPIDLRKFTTEADTLNNHAKEVTQKVVEAIEETTSKIKPM